MGHNRYSNIDFITTNNKKPIAILRKQRQTWRSLYFENSFKSRFHWILRRNLLLVEQMLLPLLNREENWGKEQRRWKPREMFLPRGRVKTFYCIISWKAVPNAWFLGSQNTYGVHNVKNNFVRTQRYHLPFPLCWHLCLCHRNNGECKCQHLDTN